MKRTEQHPFSRGGILLSLGLVLAAGPAEADAASRLEFPPLAESTRDAPKTTESLKFPPLPFDSTVSTDSVPETAAAKQATTISGADILSVVGEDDKPSVVAKLSPGNEAEHLRGVNSAANGLISATTETKGPSALSALAAAVAELPTDAATGIPEKKPKDGSARQKERPPRPEKSIAPSSGVETEGGIVRVSVYIDVPFEAIKYPEGTAMLRTKNWLRKTFPGLPEQFSVNGHVIENGFDDDDRVYRYRTEYRLKDMQELLANDAESDSKSKAEHVFGPAPEPVAEFAPEPAAEPMPESLSEPASEPAAEAAAEDTPDSDAPVCASVSVKETPADSEPDQTTAQ